MNTLPTVHVIAAVVTAIYGLVSLIGGIIGYAKASSIPSLIAGGLCGIVLLACAAAVTRAPFWSFVVSLIIALALVGRFGMVAAKNTEPMSDYLASGPGITAVVMIVGGAAVILVSIIALATSSQTPPAV